MFPVIPVWVTGFRERWRPSSRGAYAGSPRGGFGTYGSAHEALIVPLAAGIGHAGICVRLHRRPFFHVPSASEMTAKWGDDLVVTKHA
jgi:hypothetical protein